MVQVCADVSSSFGVLDAVVPCTVKRVRGKDRFVAWFLLPPCSIPCDLEELAVN